MYRNLKSVFLGLGFGKKKDTVFKINHEQFYLKDHKQQQNVFIILS